MSSAAGKSYFVSLGAEIPAELVDDFLAKLHYVSESVEGFELIQDGHPARIRFRLLPGREEEQALVAGRIVEVAEKLCRAARFAEPIVLVRRKRTPLFNGDPHPLLEERGDLFRFGHGRYGLGPRLVKLLEFFDQQLLQQAEQFGAAPYQFPTLIGADLLERCRYLQTFPHSLSFVSHLREDLSAIQDFARHARWDGSGLIFSPEDLSKVECLLASAVCFHCYAWLQDSRLPQPLAFTARGKCFRFESGNMGGLERLWDFTMRELIFVGTEGHVLAERQKAVERMTELLDEWELSYEIKSATDPFFIDEYSAALFQMAFDLKYEIRAFLPYNRKSLAVGSFNCHRDHFGRALNISCAGDEAANTGCVAFGLERLALAFLAQHGLDARDWPASVAEKIKGW